MYSLETPATQDTGRPNEQKINPTQHKTETKRMNNTDPSTKKTKRKQTHILDKQFLFLITLIKTRINPENKTLHSIEDIDLFLFLLVTELLFLILKCLHIRHPFTLKLPLVDLRDCPIKMTGLGFGYLLLLNLKFYVSYFVDHYFFFRSQYCLSFVVLQVIVLSVLPIIASDYPFSIFKHFVQQFISYILTNRISELEGEFGRMIGQTQHTY